MGTHVIPPVGTHTNASAAVAPVTGVNLGPLQPSSALRNWQRALQVATQSAPQAAPWEIQHQAS